MHRFINKSLKINSAKLHAHSTGLLQGISYSRMNDHLNRVLVPFGISIPEWKLLGQLYDNGNIKLYQLSDLLSYDPPMVTKLVKQLEKKRLLLRQMDPEDERAKMISLTAEGHNLVVATDPAIKAAMNKLLVGISREELLIYLKVLNQIVENS